MTNGVRRMGRMRKQFSTEAEVKERRCRAALIMQQDGLSYREIAHRLGLRGVEHAKWMVGKGRTLARRALQPAPATWVENQLAPPPTPKPTRKKKTKPKPKSRPRWNVADYLPGWKERRLVPMSLVRTTV